MSDSIVEYAYKSFMYKYVHGIANLGHKGCKYFPIRIII